ncbi:hypothetical protein C4578_03000 [Candidatus Microgenomates bacterium]|jgi:hypothetical protein|nr:MAG: hypothetical protein C4578_03000 [Candidatus Microgenomates bacterium]
MKEENNSSFLKSLLKYFLIAVPVILVSVVSFLIGKKSLSLPPTQSSEKVLSVEARPTKEIGKEISLEVGNPEEGKIKYVVDSAEILKQIVVKGQDVSAVPGRAFLVLNLKITNERKNGIQINTRDFIRLSSLGEEWAAPEIHNDPVEVQAISTKITKIGFPINDSDRQFKLKIGKIDGEKEEIDLNF